MISRAAIRWAVVCIAVLIAIVLLTHFWNRMWAWLPWSAESQLERAKVEATTAKSDAIARSLEVEGEREQAARVDTHHTQVIEVRDFTARAETEARSAPDAADPLPDPDSLREHQRRLCLAAPRVCGAPASVDPDGGDAAL